MLSSISVEYSDSNDAGLLLRVPLRETDPIQDWRP